MDQTMREMKAYPLRLPRSLKDVVARLTREDGTSTQTLGPSTGSCGAAAESRLGKAMRCREQTLIRLRALLILTKAPMKKGYERGVECPRFVSTTRSQAKDGNRNSRFNLRNASVTLGDEDTDRNVRATAPCAPVCGTGSCARFPGFSRRGSCCRWSRSAPGGFVPLRCPPATHWRRRANPFGRWLASPRCR